MMHLYSAGDPRALAARLAAVLAASPGDPMDPEWLAVPSDGMRRWLSLELARHLGTSGPEGMDGVAANFARAYPGTLRSAVLAAGRHDDGPDPWALDRLVWSVLAATEAHRSDPQLASLAHRSPGSSRLARARRIADLFDRYHVNRPDMITAWADGRDVDGLGLELVGHAAWQPHLWRLVRQVVGEPSPAESLPGLMAGVASGEVALELPPRLLLFGFTLLPGRGFLQLARAVAERRDVHLFLLEPTELATAELLMTGAPLERARLRSGDATADLITVPLLRSWGRLHRETAVALADAEQSGMPDPERLPATAIERPADTVLGRLQCCIRHNGDNGRALVAGGADDSVQFHACFGPIRQVQVLRQCLLHLLGDADGLREDDILVVCPALDRFAPLIEGVFGASAGGRYGGQVRADVDAPSLRYRIADQSIRVANPLLGATAVLLDLVAGRFEASSVTDFLSLAPVRQRFHFDDEDLATVADWVRATNVRWGLDADARTAFDVPSSIVTNTWQAALDQLLLGATVADDELALAVGDVAPLGVEGGDTTVLGSLADALGHLGNLADEVGAVHTVDGWVELIRRTCDALFATDREGSWQLDALHRTLNGVLAAATSKEGLSRLPLEYVDIRRLFDEHLDAMVGRPDFFRGGITFTSMTPLRWVPYRVIAILGLDQGSFSSTVPAGDDLIAVAPQLGDSDARAESRQSLLEVVLAAGEHLLVVRDGHDVRTNQPIPRAVVAAELFEAASSMVADEGRSEFEGHLEVDHPRHPFDERCLTVGGIRGAGRWGFDAADLAGAKARRARSHTRSSVLATPVPSREDTEIDLADLHAFLKNPSRAFLADRLEARLPREVFQAPPYLPVKIAGLEEWQVGERLLTARLRGITTRQWERVERVRGTLPPGALEAAALDKVEDIVDDLVDAAARCGVSSGPAVPREIDIQLNRWTRVVGVVPTRLEGGMPGPASVTYSTVKATHRLAAWLDLVALVATDPTVPWRSVSIARTKDHKSTEVVDLVPMDVDASSTRARSALAVIVDCYRRGMVQPVPLFPRLSESIVGDGPRRTEWRRKGANGPKGDGDDEAVRLAFDYETLDGILAVPAETSDPPGRGGRAERFARYLWGALDQSVCARPASDSDDPAELAGGPDQS
jgi:exodeoxyribonuclease V gamma subunit